MAFKLRNQLGVTLTEIMVTVGIISGLTLVVMNLTKQSNKSTVKMQFDSDMTLAINEIDSILGDPAKCVATFGSSSSPSNINGKYYVSTDPNAPAQGYGNSNLKVQSYKLTGTAPNGLLSILFTNKEILKGSTNRGTVLKTVSIYFEGNLGSISTCRSVTKATVDIWSRGDGSKIFYAGGNVGINNTNPQVELDVGAGGGGTVQAAKFLYSSDYRLKKNIALINDPMEKINNLRGVSFNWKESGNRDYGFVAQEVEKVLPELVSHTLDEDKLSVDYAKVIPFLVEAIKKQQIEIDNLKKELKKKN